MKLAVSNIAWDPEEEDAVLELLRRNGVAGIEIAPTKLWPGWQGADPGAAAVTGKQYLSQGFEIPALQAILFDKPELGVFSEPGVQADLIAHLDGVAGLAEAMGANVMVFGSPKNRDPGERSPAQAFAEATGFFQRAGAACHRHGVCLCIEPNPEIYHCRFLTRWREVLDMVNAVAHPGVGIHLDTACIHLEGDSVEEAIHTCAGRIAHFHVTEPELSDLGNPVIDHAAVGRALRDTGYQGWLSIEMRRTSHPLESIEASVQHVLECYLD